MFHKAYVCPWCKKDLKSKEISFMAKSYYPEEDTHFTQAIELLNKGWECNECGCRWYYDRKIFRDGIPELKDKYKTNETTENIEIENNNANNLNNERSEELNHEQESN